MPAGKPNHRVRTLIDQATIEGRVAQRAAEIDRDYQGSEGLIAIGVLKGSVFFFTDLVKRLRVPLAIDFFQTTSYGAGTTAGEVRIKRDIDLSVRGKDVLLVEDIVDSGLTLRYLKRNLESRNPASLEVCALLLREGAADGASLKYVGFEIPPDFVIGYGLDVAERYRNLPYICAYNEDI